MPKSKRSKLVSLTKTDKKGREKKEQLVKDIQENISKWKYLWLFEVGRMRNTHLKAIRADWKDTGRMFFGRISVMALALGTEPEREYMPGLSKVAKRIQGQVGLFFTDWSPEETLSYFRDIKKPDYARSGDIALRDVILPEGPVMKADDPPTPFPHSMEPQLRKLGLSTRMVNGVPTLTAPHVVCRKGNKLTSEQTQLLKLREEEMVEFRVAMRCRWDRETGSVTEADGPLERGEVELASSIEDIDDDEEML